MKVQFLNLSFDHKDYTIFDNAFSIIMNNFPANQLNWKLGTLLQGSNKSGNSWLSNTSLIYDILV